MPFMGAKRSSYIEKFTTPRKGVYFLFPRDHRKGDLIAIWEQFSPYGSASDNPIHLASIKLNLYMVYEILKLIKLLCFL